jgi:AcrR family transcriptional regulator
MLDDTAEHRDLAGSTLELLADAGLSSLAYNGIAARSGISTATLDRYWTVRVEAVTDALREIVETDGVPDTGDLRADLHRYLAQVGATIGHPRARRVLGALIAEAADDPDLATLLRERVLQPRRAEIAARLHRGAEPLGVPADAAVDQLVGPLFYRTVVVGRPPDDEFLDTVIASVIAQPSRA